jgi:YVTN family beta-propeller protein
VRKCPLGLPLWIALALLVVALAGCIPIHVPPQPPATPPALPPDEKPLVVPGIPGLYLAWSTASLAVPPTRTPGDPLAPGNHILGVDCLSYLGSGGDMGIAGVWDRRSSFDWRPIDNCLQLAARRTIKLADGREVPQPVVLTLPPSFMDTGSKWYQTAAAAPGTEGNPFVRLHLPPWMQNETYRFTFQAPSGVYYQSLRYGGEFQQRMIEFVRAAGQRYNSNPQVAAVRVYVGMQGESQPLTECRPYWDTTAPEGRDSPNCGGDSPTALMAEHEKNVSCSQYTTFVRDLSEAALRAFPDKAVVSIADASPCSTMSGKQLRKWLYEEQWAGKPIGLSMNNLNTDRQDIDERPENKFARWGKYASGRTLNAQGYPMLYEFDAHQPSVEGMYWTVLSGAGNGGQFILYHSPWSGSFSPLMWEVVDYWLASERRAWLVFRDREYPTYDFSPGFGTSGSIGDFGKYLALRNPEDAPQACSPALRRSAGAANATATAQRVINLTPACSGRALPTPAPGADPMNRAFDWQARRIDPDVSLDITVSGDWRAFGNRMLAQLTVSYLDVGADAFDVIAPGPDGGPVRHTVRKSGSGTWQRTSWTHEVYVGNLLPGDAFLRIENDSAGVEYLHEIFVTAPDEASFLPIATAIPTTAPTSPPTATPAAIVTAQPTATWSATWTAPPASSTPLATPAPTDVSPAATATSAATSTAPPPPATSTRTPALAPTATPSLTITSTPVPSRTPAAPTATSQPPALPATRSPAASCLPLNLGTVSLPGPRGLAASDRGFVAALFESSEVASVDGRTLARTWQTGSGAGRSNGVAVWRDTVVVSNRDRGTVTLHDAQTGAQRAVLQAGALPWGVAAGDARAYVANFGDNTVSVIDLVAARVLTTVAVPQMPVTVILAEGRAYALHLNGVITRLDRDGKVLGQSSLAAADTRGIGYDPLRRRLYVGSESGALIALGLPDLAEAARFALPGPAYAVTVNEGTGRIYTVDAQNNSLYGVEPDSAEVFALPLPSQGGAQGGQGLAIRDNRIAVANFAANSVSFFDDSICLGRTTPAPGFEATATATATHARALTPTRTPTRTPTPTPTRTVTRTATAAPTLTPTVRPTATAVASPTPPVVRAKVEIVWPHGGLSAQQADLANVTVYLLAGDGTGPARSLLDSVPCAWEPTVRLWAAEDNEPGRQVGVGQKRIVRDGGRTFPAWDFNDVDVSHAKDPANKIAFMATVDDVRTLSNVWTHAADARTLFPQQDVPAAAVAVPPRAVDARIQIVWPHDGLPPQQAQLANVTAYLFAAGSMQTIAPGTSWSPTVRLHWSLNNEPERAPGEGVVGVPRQVQGANGVRFVGWDFNDTDVTPANDSLNRMTFWVTVDSTPTNSNFWAHAVDARTLFPQPDVLNSCK